jgi:PAN domain
MKICPSCQSTYTDESLRFCLQDGTDLASSDGGNYPTRDPGERETVVRRDPITSDWEKSRVTQVAPIRQGTKSSNPLLIVTLTAFGMCILFGGIVAAWLFVTYDRSKNGATAINTNYGTPVVMPTISANTNADIDGPTGWQPIDFNASLNGERLTYYRGTTVEQCQADCDANSKCRAFGLVRAGYYNPEDPPMCYLLTKVTSSTPSSCCISGIKK